MDPQTISTLVLAAVSGGAGIMMTAMVASGKVSDLRSKLNGARNDYVSLLAKHLERDRDHLKALAKIEADAKYVELGKRRAATRARSNAKDRAERAAKKQGRVA